MQARETFCRFSTDGRGICDWEDEPFSIGRSGRKEVFVVIVGDWDSKTSEHIIHRRCHSKEVGDATEVNGQFAVPVLFVC